MLVIVSVSLKPFLFVKSMNVCLTTTEGSVPLGSQGAQAHAELLCCMWPVRWVALAWDFCRERPLSASKQDKILQTYPRARGNFAQW